MTITPPVGDMDTTDDSSFDNKYTITTAAGVYMKTLTSCIQSIMPKVRSTRLCVCVCTCLVTGTCGLAC